MADYINTAEARKLITRNDAHIRQLQQRLATASTANKPGLEQQIQDLRDENALLNRQIAEQHDSATGVSTPTSTTTGTTGNYTTVPTSNAFLSSPTTSGGGDGATAENVATAGSINWNVIVSIVAVLAVVFGLVPWLMKRKRK